MNLIFDIVAGLLMVSAEITGFTYNEINIISYYIILPLIYVFLLDRIWQKHVLKIAYIVGWAVVLVCITSFRQFSDDLFVWSVHFLQSFGAIGLNYVAASVVICVILPSIVLMALLLWAYPSLRQKFLALPQSKRDAGQVPD